jgi:hypothetical protein
MQVLKVLGKDSDGEEGLSTGGNSIPLDEIDAGYAGNCALYSTTSCMSEINSTRSGFGCN